MLPNSPPPIPLKVQLETACLMACNAKRKQVYELASPFIPELAELDLKSESTASFHSRIKRHLSFTAEDLVVYLNDHPEICEMLYGDSDDKRSSQTTIVTQMKNGKYCVGWGDSRKTPIWTQLRVFPTFVDAIADYVLFSCDLPRLTKEQSAWYEVDSFK